MITGKSLPPSSAIRCLLTGIKLSVRRELRPFVLIPLFINILLFTGVFIFGYYLVSTLIHQLIPSWLSWLEWLLWPLFFIGFLAMGFFTFTLFANLIAAPYFSRLSAKSLELVSGQRQVVVELGWNQVFFGELRRAGYLLTRLLPLLILFAIPMVNLFAPLLWGLFAAWGMAMEFMAYPLENRGLPFAEQKRFMQESRWAMFTFGGAVSLGLALPIVNLLMTQAAVIGATLYVQQALAADTRKTWQSE